LKVAKAALNFDNDNLNGAVQNHVSSSSIWGRGHRQLKADTPGPMRRRPDQLREAKLARVAEPDAIRWINTNGQPMTQPARYSRHRTEIRCEPAALDLADYGLTAVGPRSKLSLCKARGPTRVPYITAELSSSVGRSHLSSIGINTYHRVTPRSSPRLLRCAP
jgi:hypothetical protein